MSDSQFALSLGFWLSEGLPDMFQGMGYFLFQHSEPRKLGVGIK